MTSTFNPNNLLKMFNAFTLLYNTKTQSTGSFFENIDPKDPTSTNDMQETFYEYVCEYRELYAENPENVDVFEPNDSINTNENDTYALIIGDNSIVCISRSYLSLLYYGCIEYDEKLKWNIVKL